MAARSIWNGTVTFGELAIPVKLFSAVTDRAIHFHEVRLSDGCRIVHRRVGAHSGAEVASERIAKAYETSRAQQVVLEDEEIAAARGARPKVIEIEHFVSAEIDPVYYDHPYILGAQPGGERAYRVLLGALQRTEKVGIGRFTMRTREQLVALGRRGKALGLYTMRFADEVLDRADLEVPSLRREPSAKEIAMAERLIDTLAAKWKPGAHRDRYRDDVLELIAQKAAGAEIEAPSEEPQKQPDDLLAALQASLEGRGRRSSASRSSRAGAPRAKKRTKAKAKAKAATATATATGAAKRPARAKR